MVGLGETTFVCTGYPVNASERIAWRAW